MTVSCQNVEYDHHRKFLISVFIYVKLYCSQDERKKTRPVLHHESGTLSVNELHLGA